MRSTPTIEIRGPGTLRMWIVRATQSENFWRVARLEQSTRPGYEQDPNQTSASQMPLMHMVLDEPSDRARQLLGRAHWSNIRIQANIDLESVLVVRARLPVTRDV